jgi:hypothetical protein
MENTETQEAEQKTNEAIRIIETAQNPDIPVANFESLRALVHEAIVTHNPLNFATICCPNWFVLPDGTRTIAKMSVEMERAQICFGSDIPQLLKRLADVGISSRTLIVLSDIFSSSWIKITDELHTNTAQNVQRIKEISWRAADAWNLPLHTNPFVHARVFKQSAIMSKIPEGKDVLRRNELQVLRPNSEVGILFINMWQELDMADAYKEARNDKTGLRKIQERVAFLASLYSSDGLLMHKMMQSAFKLKNAPEVIGINLEMDLPWAKVLMWGWTLFNKLPIITPTLNGTDWSAPAVKT